MLERLAGGWTGASGGRWHVIDHIEKEDYVLLCCLGTPRVLAELVGQ